MTKYYDVITKGFYEESADNRIEISDEYWHLLNKQSQGGIIKSVNNQIYCLLDNEIVQNGEIVDISDTDEYRIKIEKIEKQVRNMTLLEQIKELDTKRIRAGFEPSIKDETTGETYLEYYTNQIQVLRAQLESL